MRCVRGRQIDSLGPFVRQRHGLGHAGGKACVEQGDWYNQSEQGSKTTPGEQERELSFSYFLSRGTKIIFFFDKFGDKINSLGV